jgi:hypothetical protein
MAWADDERQPLPCRLTKGSMLAIRSYPSHILRNAWGDASGAFASWPARAAACPSLMATDTRRVCPWVREAPARACCSLAGNTRPDDKPECWLVISQLRCALSTSFKGSNTNRSTLGACQVGVAYRPLFGHRAVLPNLLLEARIAVTLSNAECSTLGIPQQSLLMRVACRLLLVGMRFGRGF